MIMKDSRLSEPGKGRVLVVDDDRGMRSMIGRFLEKAGHECDLCGLIAEARDFLEDNAYAAALVDIMLPDGKGDDLLKPLADAHPWTAVIVLSGMDDAAFAIKTMKSGADDYLIKPVEPAVLQFSLERALRHRRSMMEKVSFIDAIASLVEALEAKDMYTRGHSQRVAEYSQRIAAMMGESGDYLDDIFRAGLVHDLGKIGTKEEVLHKPGKLTEKEYDHIKEHPVLGVKILNPIIHDPFLIDAVRHHHERVDGRGYPYGIGGSDIPPVARILAVADAYDAMTSDRPYRKAMPVDKAKSIIGEVKGTQLCPDAVDAFFEVLNGPDEEKELVA